MQTAYLRERNDDGLLREAGIGIKSVIITSGGAAVQGAGAASDARGTDGAGAKQADTMGRGMFALRDFKAGDLILEESPLAFAPRDVLLSLPLVPSLFVLFPDAQVRGGPDAALRPMPTEARRLYGRRNVPTLSAGPLLQRQVLSVCGECGVCGDGAWGLTRKRTQVRSGGLGESSSIALRGGPSGPRNHGTGPPGLQRPVPRTGPRLPAPDLAVDSSSSVSRHKPDL